MTSASWASISRRHPAFQREGRRDEPGPPIALQRGDRGAARRRGERAAFLLPANPPHRRRGDSSFLLAFFSRPPLRAPQPSGRIRPPRRGAPHGLPAGAWRLLEFSAISGRVLLFVQGRRSEG